jgi:hypothetical protein
MHRWGAMHLQAGDTVAGYRIEERIGAGGMGAVYRATQVRLDRTVALKVLSLERFSPELRAEMRARFFLEASVSSKLSHPNIVTIHDFGEVDASHHFIAMELIEGETLEDRLRRGRLEPAEAVRITYEVARALRTAHARGVIHRDLKPGNLMLHGDERSVKVVDFGLVRDVHGPRITRQGAFLGTVGYLAPETASGEGCDHRVDLYAVGVILFECLTGALPFDDSNPVQALLAAANRPVPRLREVVPELRLSEALDGLVARLLEKAPAARLASSDDLLAVLTALPEGRGLQVSRPDQRLRLTSASQYELKGVLDESDPGLRCAMHVQLGAEVVIQVLPPLGGAGLRQVAAQAWQWNQVAHAAVAPVVDLGNLDVSGSRRGALVYRTAAHTLLRAQLDRELHRRVASLWVLAQQLFEVLAVAHAQNTFHGRLAPSAVFCDGSRLQLRGPAGLSFDPQAPWTPEGVEATSTPTAEGDVFAAAMVLLTSFGPADASQRRDSSELATLVHLLEPCLSPTATLRPTARQIADRLTVMRPRLQAEVWVLGEDPVFSQRAVREARARLEQSFKLVDLAPEERTARARRLLEGLDQPPAAVVFGDLSVLVDDPVLLRLRDGSATGRVLLSTHANVDLVRRSINFCGVDRYLALPATTDELVMAVSSAMRGPTARTAPSEPVSLHPTTRRSFS